MINSNDRIDALLRTSVDAGAAPGLVAVVGNRDALLYSGAADAVRPPDDRRLTPDTIFWLASFTKLVTAIAALQLVERGLIGLDTPVDKILPAMADYCVLDDFGRGGEPLLRPARRPITLRHLLAHCSGLGYDLMDDALFRARGDTGPPPINTLASLRGALKFDPGDGWIYGMGSDWAGLVVEAVSGQPLDAYFDSEILGPLEMRQTGFGVPTKPCAPFYSRVGPDRFEEIASPAADLGQGEFLSGGAGLFGTAGDYLRLLQALLNGGRTEKRRILDDVTVQGLFRIQTGGIRAGALGSVLPTLNAPFDLFPGMLTGWSLGGLINPEPGPQGRRAGSLGWAGIANTYYWADPAAGICAVLLAQYYPFGDPAMMGVVRAFEAEVYACFGR